MTQSFSSQRMGTALAYAAEAHAGQTRKGKDEPYLSHVLAVVSLVLHYGGDEDQAITAALHDAVEDQGGAERAAEIERMFGIRIRQMVEDVSDFIAPETGQPKPAWRQRKERFLAGLTGPDTLGTRLVEACDKLSNLRDIVEDLYAEGPSTLDRFSGGPSGVLWYYSQLREILLPQVPQISAEFGRLLSAARELTGETGG